MTVGIVAALLLTVAAAAEPIRLWSVPSPRTGSPSVDRAQPDEVGTPPERSDARSASGADLGPLLQILAVGVVGAGLAALVAMRGWWIRWPSGSVLPRVRRRVGPLPEVVAANAGVDVGGARDALSRGRPRNAVVACWMRLEYDIAAAGWPRDGAETSAEYVERVVAEASVDPSAISELAALYREARFSNHDLPDSHRAAAFDALGRVESALRRGRSVPA